MTRVGTRYYYVCNSKPRRWIPLGNDLAAAKLQWARIEAGPSAPQITVEEVLRGYIDSRATDKAEPLAANSVRQYKSYATAIGDALPMAAALVTPQHIQLFRRVNAHRPRFVNGCLALLSAGLRYGAECGHYPHSPTVPRQRWIPPRKRLLSDDELRRILAHSPDWLRTALEIGYRTGARPVDVRSLRWANVGEETVLIRQKKTGERQEFELTPEVAAILARAKQRPVLGLYVVATERGRPISKDKLEQAMRDACDKAGVEDATFRDVRAKSASDAKADGQDAQAILGHQSAATTQGYLRGRQVSRVVPVRRKL